MAQDDSEKNPWTVVLGVDDYGNLTCQPAVLHAKPNEYIEFSANGSAFSVVFKGLSPFQNAVDIRVEKNGKPIKVMVDSNAKPGVYSLACAVGYAKNGIEKISMDANCPPIIIDPGFRN